MPDGISHLGEGPNAQCLLLDETHFLLAAIDVWPGKAASISQMLECLKVKGAL